MTSFGVEDISLGGRVAVASKNEREALPAPVNANHNPGRAAKRSAGNGIRKFVTAHHRGIGVLY